MEYFPWRGYQTVAGQVH